MTGYFSGFNICIIVDLLKYGALTLMSEILHYRNDRCYKSCVSIVSCWVPLPVSAFPS